MSAPTQSLETNYSALVGGHARQATDADAVASVRPSIVLEPASEEEVAAVVSAADRDHLKVLVRGGGTQLGLGFPPAGGDILVSTARLDRVVEYNPYDLTVTVQSGITLSGLQEVLGRERQALALDPMLQPAATIGGIIATNASGSRRLRYGGVRDQIIGVRVVTADGTIAAGGGKVVKNVAGYDLPKLFTGSLGTLGLIVAATFRLYPLPAASRTVTLTSSDPAPLCDLAVRVIGSTLMPAMLDIAAPAAEGGGCTMAVCFETVPDAADDEAAQLIEMSGDLSGTARTLSGEEETRCWGQLADGLVPPVGGESSLLLKASVLPTEIAPWLASLQRTARESGLEARYRAYAGHGIIFARLSGNADTLVASANALRQAAASGRRHGSLVVWDAPPSLAQRLDPWGPGTALDVMRRLKAAFDPNATLNPGRFIGRI